MKIKSIALLMVFVLLLSVSCATVTNINEKNDDGSPIWTKEIPVSNKLVYGVGSARLSTEQNSRDASYANAASSLARQISLIVDEATVVYSSESTGTTKDAYESIKQTAVSFTLKGVKTEARWTAEDGTVWTLLSVKIKDLPDMYNDAANTYIKEQKNEIAAIEKKLESLLNELKDSTDDDALKLKLAAESKASQLVDEIEVRISGINYEGVSSEIEKKLIEKGYTE